MPPCGSDGSLPSRPQWTALFDLFDIVLSVFECMCIFSLFLLVHVKKYIYIRYPSKFNFTPCRLHPTSNGNSSSESHPEYEGHAHHYVIT